MRLKIKLVDGKPVIKDNCVVYVDAETGLDVDIDADRLMYGERGVSKLNAENQKLREDKESLETRFKGIDPEKVKADGTELEKLRTQVKAGGGEISEEKLKKAAETYFGAQAAELGKTIDELKGKLKIVDEEREGYKTKHAAAVLRAQVTEAHRRAGCRAESLDDAIGHAERAWKVQDDGAMVTHDEDGRVRRGSDAEKPLRFEDWLASPATKQAKPHWFEPARGVGDPKFTTPGGVDLSQLDSNAAAQHVFGT